MKRSIPLLFAFGLGYGCVVPPCDDNGGCNPGDICVEGVCYDTDDLYFDVTVARYDDCSFRCPCPYDYPGCDEADPYFEAYSGDVLRHVSDSNDKCVVEAGDWASETWVYDSLKSLRIEVRDENTDYEIETFCRWSDPFIKGVCSSTPVSPAYLQSGSVELLGRYDSCMTLLFTPRVPTE